MGTGDLLASGVNVIFVAGFERYLRLKSEILSAKTIAEAGNDHLVAIWLFQFLTEHVQVFLVLLNLMNCYKFSTEISITEPRLSIVGPFCPTETGLPGIAAAENNFPDRSELVI